MNQSRETGRIVAWFSTKAFGFVRPDIAGRDIFVHVSQSQSGDLKPGTRVAFTRAHTDRGPQANDVVSVEQPAQLRL